MYDTKMNRITAQVSFGRDYSDRTSPDLITSVPTGGSEGDSPTFAFPAPRRRGWFRK